MSIVLPAALTYPSLSTATQYLDVVRDRNEVRLVYPITELSENDRFSIVLNTTNFVDLRSLKMYAKITGKHNIKYLFESITLRTQDGTVIEHLDQAHLIATLSDKVSKKDHTLTTVFGASLVNNENSLVPFRYRVENMFYEIPSFNMLGFFNMKKILRLSTLGALIVDFKLGTASNLTLSCVRNISGADITFELKNMYVTYDEVEVSEDYLNTYISKYERGGTLNLTYNTVTHSREMLNDLSGEKNVRIHRSVNKCKFIMSTIAAASSDNLRGQGISHDAYLPPQDDDSFFYQYKLSGQNYPSLGVRSRSQTYKQLQDCLGTNYVRNEVNDLSFHDFISLKIPFAHFRFTNAVANAAGVEITSHGTLVAKLKVSAINGQIYLQYEASEYDRVSTSYAFTAADGLAFINGTHLLEGTPQIFSHPKGGQCEIVRTGADGYTFSFEKGVNMSDFLGVPLIATTVEFKYSVGSLDTLDKKVEFNGSIFSSSRNQGSFMMGYSLNSVLDPTSRNYGIVDASSAFLTFNFGTTYPDVYGLTGSNKLKAFHVDTFLYHEQTVKVKEGSIMVER